MSKLALQTVGLMVARIVAPIWALVAGVVVWYFSCTKIRYPAAAHVKR